MPVPLTTAALVFSAILMLGSFEVTGYVVGALGVINQLLATWAISGSDNE